MPVAEYMALCLLDPSHGYYITRDPLGARGDFITAPEVSQMFGELIGLWMAAVWKQMGAPENVRLIELGPGRGTLMNDALRAAQVVPDFRAAIVVASGRDQPVLQAQQEAPLEGAGVPMFWHTGACRRARRPRDFIANEFFDALPVNQAVKTDRRLARASDRDRRRRINLPSPWHRNRSRFSSHCCRQRVRAARAGAIFEWRGDNEALELGRRIADGRGAALVIDYGHIESGLGETFQAVGQHAFADPLTAPGDLDLTAHVDFQALMRAVEAMGARVFGAH